MNECRAIACNVVEATKTASLGAKAYLFNANPGSGGERVEVIVRSRGGRWIRMWMRASRLGNFRVVTVVERDPVWRYVGEFPLYQHDLEQLAEGMNKRAQLDRLGPSMDAETLQRVRRGPKP